MMNNKMFSVCVITYNQEKQLSQTLDSIINQKHSYSYEIIVGEDCSTDGTRKVLQEYTKKYPEVVKPIYNNSNLGLLKNYYNTISHCSGKYIMECAGDDWWLPGKVEKQIKFMEDNPDYGLCYGKRKDYIQETDQEIDYACNGYTEFLQLINSNPIPAASVCFRNELLSKYLKEVNPLEKDWLMEDYPMWLFLSKNSKIKFIDSFMICYRVLNESASHSKSLEYNLKFTQSVYDIREYFSNKYDLNIDFTDYKNIDFATWAFKFNEDKKAKEYLGEIKHYNSLKNLIKYFILQNNFLRKFYLK